LNILLALREQPTQQSNPTRRLQLNGFAIRVISNSGAFLDFCHPIILTPGHAAVKAAKLRNIHPILSRAFLGRLFPPAAKG
jgi:hypothetical protein